MDFWKSVVMFSQKLNMKTNEINPNILRVRTTKRNFPFPEQRRCVLPRNQVDLMTSLSPRDPISKLTNKPTYKSQERKKSIKFLRLLITYFS